LLSWSETRRDVRAYVKSSGSGCISIDMVRTVTKKYTKS
jgi:hypothetical protein